MWDLSKTLTSKFMEMGGRAHFFLSLVGSSSISALIWDSFIPAMRLILSRRTGWHESYTYTHKHQTQRNIKMYRWHLLPHDGILTGLVFSFSFHTDHLHSTSVQRCRNTHLFKTLTSYIIWQILTIKLWKCHFMSISFLLTDLYFLCQERGLEIRFDDNFDLQLCAPNLSDQWNDPEGQDYVLSGAIPAHADWGCVRPSQTRAWRQTEAELTSWAHNPHQEEWNWCCAPSRTCWDAHTDGKCSHRWLWTVCHC